MFEGCHTVSVSVKPQSLHQIKICVPSLQDDLTNKMVQEGCNHTFNVATCFFAVSLAFGAEEVLLACEEGAHFRPCAPTAFSSCFDVPCISVHV